MNDNPFRRLPAVNEVLNDPLLSPAQAQHAHVHVLAAIRSELDALREQIANGTTPILSPTSVAQSVLKRLNAQGNSVIRTVINATGIVLHTNLGRSPMAEEAALAAYEAARGYLNLELDLGAGKRSSRQRPIRELLIRLTGAESATAVNNCAAATVIVLRALAAGREVIVSRGQLIEIGGSFRIPEIMAASGAILREVGTTNMTRIADYENAVGPRTAMLMRIHPSNYRVRGFTEEATLPELVTLGRKHGIPVVDDVGSGAMIDLEKFGLPDEPVVSRSIPVGADLVLCSGDKLLGGAQAGLILGKAALIERIERDPFMRALRLDKMTLAALEATLSFYLHPEKAVQAIPTLRMLSMKRDDIARRAQALALQLRSIPITATVEVRDDSAYVGGGSLPDLPLPTAVVAVTPNTISDAQFGERLRLGEPAVVARLKGGSALFDLRTVFERQESDLVKAIDEALRNSTSTE